MYDVNFVHNILFYSFIKLSFIFCSYIIWQFSLVTYVIVIASMAVCMCKCIRIYSLILLSCDGAVTDSTTSIYVHTNLIVIPKLNIIII